MVCYYGSPFAFLSFPALRYCSNQSASCYRNNSGKAAVANKISFKHSNPQNYNFKKNNHLAAGTNRDIFGKNPVIYIVQSKNPNRYFKQELTESKGLVSVQLRMIIPVNVNNITCLLLLHLVFNQNKNFERCYLKMGYSQLFTVEILLQVK